LGADAPVTTPSAAVSQTAPDFIPAVTLSGLTKQFGRFAALRNVTAEFAASKLYVILGENGAGKSTLLRAIAGLLRPSSGSVSVFGAKYGGADSGRWILGQLGYMAHPSLLYDEMSAMENLIYSARLYGIDDASRCAAAITLVGLDPGLSRPVGQYSQGMRQRTSLARALLHDPRLLLLDEPFSNVDVASARGMVQLLSRMRDAGKTIFVVTHQARLLAQAADEFVWVHSGNIESRVTTLDLEAVQ
jgi:ABC-type multidrug transport system ATPase subunit